MKKERALRKERLALQVGIALTAGVFGAVPVVEGAPVVDKVVTAGTQVAQSGNVTDVTGTQANNIVKWQDFSVGKGETVRFDDGAKERNYLNLVTGPKESEIAGKVEGGKDVYLVNPHGVIFSHGAQVNVGNLYVSTENTEAALQAFNAGKTAGEVLTAGTANADVVNLGGIAASTVIVNGDNIRFLTDDVQATQVTLQAAKNIVTEQDAARGAAPGVLRAASLSSSAPSYVLRAANTESRGAILNSDGLAAMNNDLSGSYSLEADLTLSGIYTPIGGDSGAFTGKFDGNFHTISGIQVSGGTYGGLFGLTSGAIIQNVGVKNGSVTAGYAGGIVGKAVSTMLTDVYNAGVSVTSAGGKGYSYGDFSVGGIAGVADKSTIKQVYNTGEIRGTHASGLIGVAVNGTKLTNAYNTGTAVYGSIGYAKVNDTSSISNVYTTKGKIASDYFKGSSTNAIFVNPTDTSSAKYSGFDISDSGSDNTVWRIYEGHSLPLLRDFLRRGKGAVTVNYNYTQGSNSGSNSGKDLTLTYNNQDVTLSNVNFVKDNRLTIDPKKIVQDTNLRNANVYDSNGDGKNDSNGQQAFYCTSQDGYDLVGNNVYINQREVNISGDSVKGKHITKVYDGKVDASDAVKALFNASDTSVTGLIAGDTTASLTTNDLKASFADKNVGVGKTVTANGTLTLTQTAHNYKVTGSGTAQLNDVTLYGDITPATLTLSLADGKTLTKVYEGKANAATKETVSSLFLNDKTVTGLKTVDSGKQDEVALGFQNNDAKGTYGTKHADGTFTPDGSAGAHDVQLTGIQLSGADAGNYNLIDASGNIIWGEQYTPGKDATASGTLRDVGKASGGTAYLNGTITKRNLTADGFTWYDGNTPHAVQNNTKEYDTTSIYTAANGKTVNKADGSSAGLVTGDQVAFTVQQSGTHFVNAAVADGKVTVQNNDAKTVKDANQIAYAVTVSGEDAKNYTLNGQDISNGGTATVYGEGHITPRTLLVAAADGKVFEKTYDGNTDLKTSDGKGTDTNPFTLADGYLAYTGDVNHQLLNDGAKITYTGTYSDKNVARDANGKATTKPVTFTAQVTDQDGSASANYVFLNGSSKNTTMDFVGKGIIDPAKITAVTLAEVSKTYDSTADNTTATLKGATGLVSGENYADILQTGTDSKYVVKNADGSYQETPHVDATNARYTISLKNPRGNYDLALPQDAKGNYLAYGKGTITPLTITKITLNPKANTPITKVYDGNNDVKHEEENGQTVEAKSYVTTLEAEIPNSTNKLTFTQDAASLGYTVAGASFAEKNSNNGQKQDVTYYLNVKGPDGFADYKFDDSLLDHGRVKAAYAPQGVIKPRKVIATAPKDIRKEYDATDAVVKANANDPLISYTHFPADGQPGLVSGDADASTGVYRATAAAKKNGEQDADAGAKDVRYTLGIQTSDPTNYEIVDASGQKVQTLTGSGTIDKRGLTISFDHTTKTYDGTAAVPQDAAHILPQFDDGAGNAVIAKDGTQAAFDVTQVRGEYHDAAGNKVSDVGTDLAVAYSNLVQALDSHAKNYAKNYIINGGTDAAKGMGDITKLKLTNLHFSFDVTKEYDGTTDVAYTDRQGARHEAVSFIGDHYVDLNGNGTYDVGDVLLGGADKSGLTIQSAQYAGKDAGNQQVTYEIGLGNLNNYDLSGISNVSSGDTTLTFTAQTQGTITPRKVYASLATPKEVTKVYDGDTSIRQGKALQNIMSDVRLDGLLAGDGVRLDSSATQATYADENAGRNKNVCYKIALTGAQKKNYEVVGADGNPLADGQLVSKGTGTIEKAPLTIGFGRVEKTFDNRADVTTSSAAGDVTTIQPTLSGFVNGEKADFDPAATRLIEGYYTAWDGKTGTPAEDVHVRRDSSGSVVDKAVCYKGIDKAFADLAARDDVLKNYEIAAAEPGAQFLASGTNGVKDTVYFSEALQKGRIKPLALAQGQIQEKWTASTITKEYDTTDQVLDPKQYFTLHETVTGKDIPITYDLKSAVYDNHRVDQTNGQQVGVTYTINGISQQALGDFVIDQTTQDAFKNQTYHTTGEITPKLIRAKLDKTAGIVKTYDGKTDADPKNLVFDESYDAQGNRLTDAGIYAQDKVQDKVQAVVKAVYDDKNATIDDPGAVPTNARTITYTLSITDETRKGNYALDTSAAQNTYLATGDIARRKVYVDFTGGSLDKVYDGTPYLKSSVGSPATLLPLDAEHETGVVQGDDVHLDASKASGRYASAHVRRDASGKPVAQDVYLSGITFGGNDVGNYILAANPGSSSARTVTKDGVTQVELTGHGVISPVTIAVSLKNRNITQEYDGTTAVDSKYLSDNLQWDTAPLIARGDKLVTKWVHTPVFASKNVKGTDGRGTNPVTFDFSWSNVGGDGATYHDYDVVPGTSGSVTGQGAQAVAHLTANGKITPRLLIASSGARATKVYDATPDVLGDAGKNLVFTRRDGSSVFGMGDTINDLHVKADAKYLETAPGRGDAADATAGVAADGSSLPLLDHDVAYTNITLGNDNYALDPVSAKSVTGKGTITRATLKLTAEPVTIRAWQDLPLTYQGQASGWQGSDGWSGTDIRFAPAADQRNYPAGKYPIWAWYRTGQDALGNGLYTRIAQGAYGKNYEVVEDPANRTALTILPGRASDLPLPPDMPTAIDAATASGKGFIPDRGAYNHISHDEGHSVIREPQAGLAYADGGVNAGHVVTSAGGDVSHSMMDVQGQGEIVNLTGGDAAQGAMRDVTRHGKSFTLTGSLAAYGLSEEAAAQLQAQAGTSGPEETATVGIKGGNVNAAEGQPQGNLLGTKGGDSSRGISGSEPVVQQSGGNSAADASPVSPAAGATLFHDASEGYPGHLAATEDAHLFDDAVPAVTAAGEAHVSLFDDSSETAGREHSSHGASGAAVSLFGDEPAAQPASGAGISASGAVKAQTSSADEVEDEKEKEEAAHAAALKAKGADIGIESEGAGVNLAG